jgi:hypothetical protein
MSKRGREAQTGRAGPARLIFARFGDRWARAGKEADRRLGWPKPSVIDVEDADSGIGAPAAPEALFGGWG